MVAHVYNHSTWRLGQEDCYTFEALTGLHSDFEDSLRCRDHLKKTESKQTGMFLLVTEITTDLSSNKKISLRCALTHIL